MATEDGVPGRYVVLVDDNFHYMDESERRVLGTFDDPRAAIAACEGIVDASLTEARRPGMTAAELYRAYQSFGEDPFIRTEHGAGCAFSAWEYARARCDALCVEPAATATCAACGSRAITQATLPFQRTRELYGDSQQGWHLAACKACSRRFLEIWREVARYGFEDIWAFWAPLSREEEARITARFSSDTAEGMRAARELVESREHLVRDPMGTYSWSGAASEVGLGMHL